MPPRISIVIPTFNRLDDLKETLKNVQADPYPNKEILVIDNASTDGTRKWLRSSSHAIHPVLLSRNTGAKARNIGLEEASGKYVLMLDSDSNPKPGALEKMVAHFRSDPKLGAAAFRVILPNKGNIEETGGTHNVFIGCGCGFVKDRLKQIGGYPKDYGYYVEEYDVSYRMLNAGYNVRYFDDLEVVHRQSSNQRNFGRILRYLVRNNLYLYFRYLPFESARRLLHWELYRYRVIAQSAGFSGAFYSGLVRGAFKSIAPALAASPANPETLDRIDPARYFDRWIKEKVLPKQFKTIIVWGIGKHFGSIVNAATNNRIQIHGAIPTSGQKYFADKQRVCGIPVLPPDALESQSSLPILIGSCSVGETKNEQRFLQKQGIQAPTISLPD